MSKHEVAKFTFKDKDWEGARSNLLPYRKPDGTFDLTYSGKPLPENADVEVPHIITELFSYVGQGMNFDVIVYQTSENPDSYQVDITRVWR